VLKILEHTYLLDAFLSISKIAAKNNLTFSEYNNAVQPFINIAEMFHPFLKDPVSNDVGLGEGGNLCFVSGPNMAGKSTFLKSVGVCIYLAHLGFPVPARQMETTLFNGIFSSINLSDSINQGYSHYYSEVRRVKEIVLAIKERNRVCVIFDELFKGTNVKDAYDATLMVMTGFAKMKSSIFFASTHIIEVASELKNQDGVVFKYLDSSLNGSVPVYTYKLLDGVSSERLGLLIVKQEGIMQIIDEILKKE
jgi:DNA mismatch repair ATPase MutS